MGSEFRVLTWVCIACACACADSATSPTASAPLAQQPAAPTATAGQTLPPSAAGTRAAAAGTPGLPLPSAGSTAPLVPPAEDAGVTKPLDVDAGPAEPPAAGAAAPLPSTPGTIKVFDQIPQYGIYATEDPKGFTPPAGVLMWSHGTQFAVRLSPEQKAKIGADLKARVTYHAQCDNYDRLGGAFFLVTEPGRTPTDKDTRSELVRFITPFSDFQRGALATYVFEDADIASHAAVLADPTHDVWVGIGGGSNPYAEDPCANTNKPAEFKAVGFKYSLELVSTKPLSAAKPHHLSALYNVQAMKLPITADLDLKVDAPTGHVTVIISGHGAEAGGNEYMHTMDSLSVDGQVVGMFSTQVDCAKYAKFSPDGNQGIFRNNSGGNPRNWCPGMLVAPRSFPVQLKPGLHKLSLAVDPARMPEGSYYATSISFSTP